MSIAFLCTGLAIGCWLDLGTRQQGMNLDCHAHIATHYAGLLVRVAIWMMVITVALIASVGFFETWLTHGAPIGIILLLVQMYYGISLALPAIHPDPNQSKPSPAEIAVGIMLLDALNLAAATPIYMKKPLGMRWFTKLALAGQGFGLLLLGLLIGLFTSGDFQTLPDCLCFQFFWWAWLGNCNVIAPVEKAAIWLYYAFRCLNFVQNVCFGLKNTGDFQACKGLHPVQRYLQTERIEPGDGNAIWQEMQVLGTGSPGAPEDSESVQERNRQELRRQRRSINSILSEAQQRRPGLLRRLNRKDIWGRTMAKWTRPAWWHRRRNTANQYFLVNCVFSLTSMAAAEVVVRDFNSEKSGSQVTDYWEQNILFLVACGAVTLELVIFLTNWYTGRPPEILEDDA